MLSVPSTMQRCTMIYSFPPFRRAQVQQDLRIAVRKELRRARRQWLMAGAPLLLASSLSMAQAVYTGPDNGAWTDPANWSGAAVPTTADAVTIDIATVDVDGSTTANAASLNIAGADGGLRVRDGGQLDVVGDVSISGADAQATVTGSGSLWSMQALRLGLPGGTGVLRVEDGGELDSFGASIGDQATAVGTLTLQGVASDGTRSRWQDDSLSIYIGNRGQGSVSILDGAQATLSSVIVGAGANTGDGELLISGVNGAARSTLINRGIELGGAGSDGELRILDGALATNLATTDNSIAATPGSTGTVLVSGTNGGHHSTWAAGGRVSVGFIGDGSLDIVDGGQVTSSSGFIAAAGGSEGTVLIEGEGSSWVQTGELIMGVGESTLTLRDGGALSASNVRVGTTGASVATVNIGGDTGAAAVAGTLTTPTVMFSGGSGTLNFNHTSNDLQFGAVISSAVNTATINQRAGTTVLTGNSGAFTGATHVLGGELVVGVAGAGTLGNATSTVDVASGARLSGSGVIGGTVTVADGGILAPGNSPGTLTLGGLVLNNASVLEFELGETGVAGGALNDLLVVNGDLTLDGVLNVTQSAGGTYGAGIYRLIDYTGVLTDNTLDLGSMPAGSANFVQTSVANQVNLVNTQGLVLNYWDGPSVPRNDGVIQGGNGTWLAAGDENWTVADGSINAPFQDGAVAIFTGIGGTVMVDDSQGAVNVSGMQFAVDGYRVEGDAVNLAAGMNTVRVGDGTAAGVGYTTLIASELTGAGGLNKTDEGTLMLSAANTYTGGTTISGGVLILGDGGTSGEVVGDITNNATLFFDRSNAVAFDNVISGTGDVYQYGTDTLSFSAAHGYTGHTYVGAGTLALVGTGSIAASSYVNVDAIFDIAGTTAGAEITTLYGSGTAVLGTQALTLTAGTGTFNGVIDGVDGVLNKRGSGQWGLAGVGSEVGELNVEAGTLLVDAAGAAAVNVTRVAANATLNNAGTLTGTLGDDRVELAGAMIGSIDLLDGDDTVVISSGADFTQAQFLGGAGVDTLDLTYDPDFVLPATLTQDFEHLIKRGTGQMTLAGTVAGYSDSIVATGGSVLLDQATVQTAELRLDPGVRLTGAGAISGDLINHGLISAGTDTTPGTIVVGGDYLQSATGGRFSQVTRTGNDLLEVAGTASLAGEHQIQVTYGLYLENTTQTLLSAAGGITGNYSTVNINPSALMPATHEVGANAETLSFIRLDTTTVTDPGTNKENFAEWLDREITGGGLTPDMEDYVDTLLQQPTREQANELLGEIADPVLAHGHTGVAILGASYAASVFERFAFGELAQCSTTQEASELKSCAWVSGLRQWGDGDGDAFGPRYDWTTDGGQFGIDHRYDAWTLGVTVGHARMDINDIRGGHNDLRSTMGGLYAHYEGSRVGLDLLGFYAQNENRTRRSATLGAGTTVATAKFDNDSYGAAVRLSYRLTETYAPMVRPYIEAFYQRIDGAQVLERSAAGTELAVTVEERTGLRGKAGIQFADSYEGYGVTWRPTLDIGVLHQLEDERSSLMVQPVAGAAGFHAYGAALDKTAYAADAVLNVEFSERASVWVGYGGEVAGNYSQHEVGLGLRLAW